MQATRELLKYGMDPNKRNAAGYTPLHFAVVQNCVPHADMIRVLIENGRGIDVNAAIGDELAGIRNRAGRKGAGKDKVFSILGLKSQLQSQPFGHSVFYW